MSSPSPTNEAGNSASPAKKWVQFEEDEKLKAQSESKGSSSKAAAESERNGSGSLKTLDAPIRANLQSHAGGGGDYSGAIISTESVHVTLDRGGGLNRSLSSTDGPPTEAAVGVNNLRTVDLHDAPNGRSAPSSNAALRQGFANGDIIVTLLPVNSKFPWITPAKFRPELVPEELMAQELSLTVEDYVHIMEILTNDVRFTIYNVCYKRVLVLWIFTAFIVLLSLLFSGLTGLTLFGFGILWLVMNASAIFFCMWMKYKMNYHLERCMANVNKHLLRHRIILGLDDRGKMSCHKVNLCFIFFDTTDCIKKLQEVIDREEAEGRTVNRDEERSRKEFAQRMDIEDGDIIIQGTNPQRRSRKQERAALLLLRYSSRWAKLFVRQRLDLSVDGDSRATMAAAASAAPRHCVSARCPCQFIEEHLKYKPRAYGVKQDSTTSVQVVNQSCASLSSQWNRHEMMS
ncbi:transmembrane protein 268 isoform X3 [Nilaparvata lugens]|uniref:transmembrane protein 268 isoform X3 n=1 Tax=Nilaparvata lugens TaxID=108931 RepID=UPI00193D48C0|nr:transmembrane protein 268 isoform X3 [Nilaparvata lugens]